MLTPELLTRNGLSAALVWVQKQEIRTIRNAQAATPEVIVASKSVSVSGPVDTESTAKQSVAATDDLSSQRLYHGTRADLKPGDLIEPGYTSNYSKEKKATYVYLTATLDAATWGRSWHSAMVRQNRHS
jgi:hypothetical protein